MGSAAQMMAKAAWRFWRYPGRKPKETNQHFIAWLVVSGGSKLMITQRYSKVFNDIDALIQVTGETALMQAIAVLVGQLDTTSLQSGYCRVIFPALSSVSNKQEVRMPT